MGKMALEDLLLKPVLTEILFLCPGANPNYKGERVLSFTISVREYAGPVTEEKSKIRFQKELLNCKDAERVEVSVEPPVELISGRTYSISLEVCCTIMDWTSVG